MNVGEDSSKHATKIGSTCKSAFLAAFGDIQMAREHLQVIHSPRDRAVFK